MSTLDVYASEEVKSLETPQDTGILGRRVKKINAKSCTNMIHSIYSATMTFIFLYKNTTGWDDKITRWRTSSKEIVCQISEQ